jgi:hypothetical protein
MARGNEKFLRRQKEIARQQRQKEKRLERADRKSRRSGGAGDDDIAAIRSALDAGENPGSAEARVGEDGEDAEGDAATEES